MLLTAAAHLSLALSALYPEGLRAAHTLETQSQIWVEPFAFGGAAHCPARYGATAATPGRLERMIDSIVKIYDQDNRSRYFYLAFR